MTLRNGWGPFLIGMLVGWLVIPMVVNAFGGRKPAR
jgi:hypothetical protein